MKTIDEIRRENLTAITLEKGGATVVAALMEKSISQISQWVNGSANSGTGKPRGMRSASCREIEIKCGKPPGWMDADHSFSDAAGNHSPNLAPVPAPATYIDRIDQDEMEMLSDYRLRSTIDKMIIRKTISRLPVDIELLDMLRNKK